MTFAAAGMALGLPVAGQTTAFPSRPMQLLVPAPAGGISDTIARTIAPALEQALGGRVIVVNRPGAGLVLGAQSLVQAPADGHTLLMTPVTPFTIQPHRNKNLGYSKDSVVPVCQIFDNPFLLAVGPKSRFKDAKSLLAYAKAHPAEVRYATSGVASSMHLAGAELWQKLGLQLVDVPYPGESPATMNLISGDVDAAVMTSGGVIAGGLRPLAVFGGKRVAMFPDVPTLAELKLPQINPSGYGGIFMRAGTDAALLASVEEACRKAVDSVRYRAFAQTLQLNGEFQGRGAFAARINSDYAAKDVLLRSLKLAE